MSAERDKRTASLRNFYAYAQRDLQNQETIWRLMSPANLLKKGFALLSQNGKIITASNGLKACDEVFIRMQDAELTATITHKTERDENDAFNL